MGLVGMVINTLGDLDSYSRGFLKGTMPATQGVWMARVGPLGNTPLFVGLLQKDTNIKPTSLGTPLF